LPTLSQKRRAQRQTTSPRADDDRGRCCACAVAALHSMPLHREGSQGITPSHHQQNSRAMTQGPWWATWATGQEHKGVRGDAPPSKTPPKAAHIPFPSSPSNTDNPSVLLAACLLKTVQSLLVSSAKQTHTHTHMHQTANSRKAAHPVHSLNWLLPWLSTSRARSQKHHPCSLSCRLMHHRSLEACEGWLLELRLSSTTPEALGVCFANSHTHHKQTLPHIIHTTMGADPAMARAALTNSQHNQPQS
jgi:hypothetical protein